MASSEFLSLQSPASSSAERALKKVLVIAYYFPPMGLSGVQRALKFVKYLPEFGWKPIVLTIAPTAYYAYDETLLNELDMSVVEVHRSATRDVTRVAANFSKSRQLNLPKAPLRRLMSAISQTFFVPDNKIGWKKSALAKASEIIEKQGDIELVFSTAPPFTSHLIALELRKKYQLPVVADFRDPWVENPLHFYATPLHRRWHQHLEEKVLLGADKIVAVNRLLKEQFLRAYRGKLAHRDIVIIPHGYDPKDFEGLPKTRVNTGKFRLLYSGTLHSSERSPKPFFLGLKKAIEKNPNLRERVEARFVGLFPSEYLKLAASLGLDGIVQVAGYKSHRETIAENFQADVLWATQSAVKRIETITQGKLFEYVACGRTLFGITPEGASRQFVLEANGVVAHPNNPDEIAAKILDLFEMWKSGTLPVPPKDVVEKYDRRNLTAQLAREFEQLLFA
ncbi:MAG: glycosyltransferase [Chloroherpetonaceae bacterium]|nr:glycosyltransferase [Chloroherpetonaceae bacterium]MDW8438095.1 glycosyltransferase [Chloroherpetonaceae bacterium]